MNKLVINKEFPFAYETHLHTSQGSKCGKNTGAEMAVAHKEAGYDGIIVTDHFFYGNTAPDRSLSWTDWVIEFYKGYEDAKQMGDRIGLKVFFGWEASYQATDFLITGLSKKWLLTHPEIKDASIEEQYRMVKRDGGMVIHAHPFREDIYIPKVRLFPEYVDGVEIINATHYHKYAAEGIGTVWDKKAAEYAREHDFPVTAGSDIHNNTDLMYGGMAFKEEINSIFDYINAILERKECRLLGAVENTL